jgi:hypothetical protein
MRKIHLALLLVILSAGCAINSGVVPMGKDTFLVSRQAATGFTGLGELKAEAIREAHQFCKSIGKFLQVVRTSESSPPYVFGNFPRAEVQFMCLNVDDPELKRTKLKKEADTVIEIRK